MHVTNFRGEIFKTKRILGMRTLRAKRETNRRAMNKSDMVAVLRTDEKMNQNEES